MRLVAWNERKGSFTMDGRKTKVSSCFKSLGVSMFAG